MRARMQPGFPEAVLAAISQSTNELTQGWMRLMASAPAAADTSWLGAKPALQGSSLAQRARSIQLRCPRPAGGRCFLARRNPGAAGELSREAGEALERAHRRARRAGDL